MPKAPRLTRSEDHRAILRNVLFDQDARLGSAQRLRRGVLVIEKRAIGQIFAIMLDQVEDIAVLAAALRRRSSKRDRSSSPRTSATCRRSRLLPASR
jgi:hypothetical protein